MGVDKAYLNRQITAADPSDGKSSVRFVTTTALSAYTRVGNVITSNANVAFAAQDGVTPVLGNSVLLTDDGTASNVDNGIYTITQLGSGVLPWVLTRRSDANANDLVNSGMHCFIEEGAQFDNIEFLLVTPNPIILNTTALDFQPVATSGGFSLTLIDSPKKIPEDQSMVVMEDVVITDGGDLLVEGDVTSARTEDNYAVLYLPAGSEKVVQENEEMFYSDDMTVDGTLTVDGQISDVTPPPADPRVPQLGDTTLTGTVQTTNATPTLIATYNTLADNRAIAMNLTVLGFEATGSRTGHFSIEVTAYRNSASTVTVLEDLFLKNYTTDVNWDVTFVVVGTTIQVFVTGDVAQMIEWRCFGGVSEHG